MFNWAKKIDCFILTICQTIQHFFKTGGDMTPVIGHVYAKYEVYRNCRVEIAYCKHCGHMTISWCKETGETADAEILEFCGTHNTDINHGPCHPTDPTPIMSLDLCKCRNRQGGRQL